MRTALALGSHRLKLAVAGLSAALLLVVPAAAAGAQSANNDGQNQPNRVSALVDPGVQFITTIVGWSVRLTYADAREISGRSNIDKKGRINYASGSGFVVNPNGTIVTASHVIEPDQDDIRNYAANQIFFGGGLGYRLDSGDDPYGRFRISDNRFLNSLLQQCYTGVACSFAIKPEVQVYSPVQIAGASAPKGAPARVLKSTGFEDTDVAVIQIDGNNMPTVPLADTAGNLTSGTPVTALGFAGSVQQLPTGVTEPTKAFGRVSSVRSAGSSKVVQVDIDIEGGMSGGPVVNDDGKVIGLTSFSFTEGTTRTQGFLRTVDEIKETLQGAGVQAARGEVDTVFANAMNLFWGRHYSAAVPEFQKVNSLYDGHPAAKIYLAQAQAKAGGPEDVPVKEPSSFPVGLVVGLGVGALLIVGVVVLLVIVGGRRRKAAPAGPAGPQPLGMGAWSPGLAGPGTQASQSSAGQPTPGLPGQAQVPYGPQPVAHTAPAASPSGLAELPLSTFEAPTTPLGAPAQAPAYGPAYGPEPAPVSAGWPGAGGGQEAGGGPEARQEAPIPPAPSSPATPSSSSSPAGPAAVAEPAPATAPSAPAANGSEPAAAEAAPAGRRFCSSCGTAQDGQARFCTNCGAKFD